MPFISRNPSSAVKAIVAAGFFSASVQCIFFREYLSIFSGNEFVIGVIMAVWLCATGLGSFSAGRATGDPNISRLILALMFLATAGVYTIRASRLFFTPGELLGPLPVLVLCIIGEAPFAFVNGNLFGRLSKDRENVQNPYGAESLGTLIGAIITFVCVILYAKNVAIMAIAALPVVLVLSKTPRHLAPALAFIAALMCLDGASMHWKYNFPFSEIIYGREGEIAEIKTGDDVSYMFNGVLYKSTMAKPSLEQAVHVPLCGRPVPRSALVIFDKGHCRELAKYSRVAVDCLESEPRLAAAGCVVAAPETFQARRRYDAIFLGSGIPQTAAGSRLYTVSFFKTMKNLMTESGVFTFTLPLSENYLSPSEKHLSDVLKSTLATVFKNILVFPGNGYTFMASDQPMSIGKKPSVKTDYLESMILPYVTPERIAAANVKPLWIWEQLNTANRPIGLVLGLKLWVDMFRGTWPIVAALFTVILLGAALILPKSKEVLSIGSTGFVVGIYSVALLLLYQSTYGLLYSRMSLLLCGLTLGFALGTLIKRLARADLVIGLYCIVSVGLLSLVPYPPVFLFYCAPIGMGVLAGAQFKLMRNSSAGMLYAADCIGGAAGMALTVALIPMFGIMAVAGGMCVVKGAVWLCTDRK